MAATANLKVTSSMAYDLRLAFMTQQLYLVFQPKVCARTFQVVGAEVLLRWQHPKQGLIPADQWIALAESHNLIRPLTLWLVDQAIASLQSAGKSAVPLAINVPPGCLDEEFAQYVVNALAKACLPSYLLEIEITESTPILNAEILSKATLTLQSNGLNVYLDDFGSGYATMQYLTKISPDGVKIDKSFIQQTSCLVARIVLRTLIDLAHEIGAMTVCEGVETEEQLALVQELKAQTVQGYLTGRPMLSEDFMKIISCSSPIYVPSPKLYSSRNPEESFSSLPPKPSRGAFSQRYTRTCDIRIG